MIHGQYQIGASVEKPRRLVPRPSIIKFADLQTDRHSGALYWTFHDFTEAPKIIVLNGHRYKKNLGMGRYVCTLCGVTWAVIPEADECPPYEAVERLLSELRRAMNNAPFVRIAHIRKRFAKVLRRAMQRAEIDAYDNATE